MKGEPIRDILIGANELIKRRDILALGSRDQVELFWEELFDAGRSVSPNGNRRTL